MAVAFGGVEEARPLRLFCQDESRLGLQLPTGRRLTGPGVKPHAVVCRFCCKNRLRSGRTPLLLIRDDSERTDETGQPVQMAALRR